MNAAIDIAPLVVADLARRVELGVREYGSPLSTDSPNDALQFAYEEALDLVLYLRQELERRAEARDPLADLPPDLLALLRDQSVLVPRDAWVFELVAKWANAPSDTASADGEKCPSCGEDATDNWFDRSLCPEPCGSMHTCCANCGHALDGCPLELMPDRAIDDAPEYT